MLDTDRPERVRFVARLNRAGLYVVIDEHVAAPAGRRALGIIPMADSDQSPKPVTYTAAGMDLLKLRRHARR